MWSGIEGDGRRKVGRKGLVVSGNTSLTTGASSGMSFFAVLRDFLGTGVKAEASEVSPELGSWQNLQLRVWKLPIETSEIGPRY
ncbi:hypothetical protein LIER_26160 [Lithospermum erythrorhizon]|uniref:Uncharacterized protein n=1 Tax=Lithospermum erythrorhizon TaxID=34254 RepID=A0AAV3R7E1_LITER